METTASPYYMRIPNREISAFRVTLVRWMCVPSILCFLILIFKLFCLDAEEGFKTRVEAIRTCKEN